MWPFLGSSACCSVQVCRTPEQVAANGLLASQAPSLSSSPAKRGAVSSTSSPVAAHPGADAVGSKVSPLPLSTKEVDKLHSVETASIASTTKNSTSRSAYSAASSVGSEFINEQIPRHQRDVAKIQSQMKSFVKGMVRGREMNVISVDGQLRACTCSFDRKLRNYNIVISKETRSIPLSKFREVFQAVEPEDIATPLDELCATFVLDSGECLSFRFKDVPERENFAMCLQIIVDGHQ
ncbi:unnamed protein product [Polarella glacialis]|uniref:Uncharacterized protein n=1 Tax=Polarella glacialis TaxID=89957 RepID=A0A813EDW5_POLGL|nr:unnamed protein product [Polarella glacialis]